MSYDDVRKQLMQATYQKNTGSQATQAKSAASTPAPARSSGYDEVYAQLESSLGSDARLRDARNRAGQASGRNSLEEKYGTIDEIRALDEQQDSFKRFSLGAGAVAKYLQSDNWDDNNNHQWYSDLVSSRQQEIADAMAAAGDNRALKSRLQQYADAYGNLAQGLADRQSFFGQFQGKADYNSYASAVKAARSTKASGKSYDDWYQQANADIETASGRVTELENRLANATLQASTGMWDENGVYLGEDKAAADEARRLKAELERARQDEADKRRIGSYAKAWRYQDLPETKGFRSAAAEGLRKFAADSAAERSRQQEQRAQREAEFNALGTGGLVYEDDLMTQLREDTAWREPAEDWTEQERNTFGYLYAQDPERAYEYGQYINDRNKAQTRYEQEQKVGDWATKNFGTGAASFAAGILTMPAALADYLDYAAEYAARGTVTQREYMSLADYGNVMVGAVSQGLNERYGTVDSKIIDSFGWGDVYQLGVSIGQSMLWGGAGKALGGAVGLAGEAAAHFGSTATLGMFFGSAAKSGFEDARAQGVDDGKALWYGFASGIAEAGCEVLSLDKLLTIKSPTSLTKLLKNVLVQSGVEASEELATTICNRISDQLINGDKSEISTKIALGMAKGMSYEEAAKEAEKEWLQSAAADALGGFLSGGISGGMASGFESLGRYRGNTEQLIDQGLASGGEAEAIARDMQDWMKRGETVTTTPQSAAQTAPLAQGSQSEQSSQTQERESEGPKKNSRTRRISNLQAQRLIEAIEETDRSKLKNAVEIRLQEMQESVNEPGKNLSPIAEAVAKSVQGDKLNRVEEEALKNSHFGEHLIHELSAEKLMTGGSIPEWVRNIGAERLGGGLYSDTETQAENLTAEPTEEQKKQNRTETMRGILSRSSEAAGVQMTDEEATAIAEGYEAGTNGRLYAAAATDAYKLGKSGQYSLEEAMKASQYTARISADQFRRAFETGAGAEAVETNAVDAGTEEGKQTLTAALSSLGEHAEDAASAYEAGQDVSIFAAGMSEAAERYAVTGADIRAQEGGVPAESVISTLTDAQIKKAQEIGGRLRETRAAAVSQLAEQRKAIRAQAQAIEQQGVADAAALTEVNRQIREANKIGRETVEMFEAQRDALTKAVEADPDFQNTEEYAKAFDEAKENMERAVELQKSVEELQARKKEIEGKAPVKRKKGTVSLDGGNIAGTDYAGIDRSKLTRQQQNIVAMVERLADFINIDYVVFDGPANMGGAYMQGGRLYININAGMTQEGRKSIAAASLSHELTHFMQEYAPEEYQQLKDYVVKTILNKSQTEFDRMIRQQRRWEPGKSYDELADELVANACQTMLTDDKAVQRMARSNMTLAQKVADVLDEIGEKIRKAFEGLSFDENRAIFAPVKAVMDEIDGITDRWADGISAAVENYNAEQTVRNSVPVEEVLQERYNRYKNIQFQTWDDTTDDTASESRGRDIAYARLQSENAILTETVAAMKKVTSKQDKTIAALQKRLQVTTTPEVRQSDARKLAKALAQEHGSKADVDALAKELKALGDYILQTETDKLSEDEIKNRARSIARDIVESASEQISIDDGTYSEIADNIKGRKLSIDEAFLGELDQAGGYDRFRKSLFGRLTIAKRESNSRESREDYTSVDQFYTDMQNTYGKAFFPDAANEGEQVQILARMLDAAKPMEVNPFEQYMGEATEEMANRIVMDAMNGVLRQTAPTTADRQKARTQALKEQIDQLKAENKLEQREAASLYHTVYDLTVALDKAQSKYQTLRTEADYRAAQLRAEGTARAAEIKAAERERAEEKIAQLKAHYQEMRESAKARREESAGVTKYRKQVEKKAKKLYEMLMTNSNDLHVPEVLKTPLGEFLESLDFSSKRSLAGGEDTVADANFGARLVRIQQMLDNQQRYIDGDGSVAQDLGGYIDVSPEILEYLRGMAEMITTAMSTGRTFTVNQMTAADLKTLSDFMSNLRTAINNMNRFMANARYASVQTAAQADIERMKRLGKASEASASAAVRFAGWENGTPYYITKRLGPGAKSIFDGFAKGWERLAFNAQEIIDFTKNLYTDEEVRDWKRDIHDITLSDGSKVKMTTAQIMELSMLLGREQAVKHITRGGIRIGDIETKRGKLHDTAHYHLSDEDIRAITGMLTERQMKVAKEMQKFMAERGAEWGNEVSMRRFGYKFYEEGPGYYPIKTDSNDRPMADTDAQTNSMFRLLNLSSSKALNPKASNALVVGDIFDTFADHMSDMAKLNGMGLPILDAIKWFNYKERVNYEDGTYDTVTLQGAMEEAFGEQAQRYFRTLMKDINGVNESGDRGTSLPSKMMSNYKIAAVAANLRVAFLQPTSYVRASTVLKPKHMIGILPSKAAYREAMKYSGTAVWKSLGYYETDISKSMRQQITHDDSFKDKVADKSMALAELGDQATWSMLWQACKRQAKAESPALSHDALMEKTAALFREVVYSSQVMDSTLTRSEIMRGKTGWTKAMSAFMAEPTLSYNILMDAASELDLDVRENGKEGAWKRNSGKIGKAVSVYVASAAFAAVVESIWDAIRDDDDEDFWEKFNQALWGEDGKLWTGNFMQDLTILGKIPYVKNFISTLQGYSSGDMSVAAFNNLVNVFNIWAETIKLNTGTQDKATKITYYGKMTEWGKVQKTLQALSQLSGFAVYNLTRDATAIWNTAMDVAGKQEWKIRTYDADRLSQSKLAAYNEYVKETGVSKRQFQSILTAADTSGNGSLTQDELGTELSRAVKAGEITNAQAEAIWKTKWNGENSKTFAKWSGAAAPSQGKATATGKTEKPAGSSMSFEDFKKTATVYDKEAVYNGYLQYVQPLGVNLSDFTQFINEANTDGNSSVKQAELGEKLYEAVQSGQMTEEEANAWFLVFWNEPGSKTYTKWAAKNKK